MTELVRIRASSLSTLFDCPARWEAEHLLGLRKPSSAAAHLGTAVHASTAVFDESNLNGNPVSIDDAAGTLVDTIYQPEDDVAWDDLSPKKAESIGLALHSKYCSEIAPAQTYSAVELACESLQITDLGIELTGTTDRIYIDKQGRKGIADIKTGKRAVEAKTGKAVTKYHKEQMAVYELLAEHAAGERLTAPAMIIGLKTQGKAQAGTGKIRGARDALVGDSFNKGLLERASEIIRSGNFYGNPRSFLCSAKYCPRHSTCPYKGE